MVRDSEFAPEGKQTARLLDICQKAGATHCLTGPSAGDYFEESSFAAAGIAVEWMSYGPYPVYPQRGPAFDHAVSVIDLLFFVGTRGCGPLPPDSRRDGDGNRPMTNIWRPLGRVFTPSGAAPWSVSHAAYPTALALGGRERVRIFYSTRDAANRFVRSCHRYCARRRSLRGARRAARAAADTGRARMLRR